MGKLVGFLLVFLYLSHSSYQNSDDDLSVEVETEPDEIEYISPVPSGSHYLVENFDDVAKFKKKWIKSEAKKDGVEENVARYNGEWAVEPPQVESLKGDLALILKSKAKHAAISAPLDRAFHFTDRPLVVQYEVNFQEGQECGGAYLKLLSQGRESADLRQFVDKTPYTIMFGPDKCGNDLKLHFIFRHKNPNNGSFEEKHCKKSKERLQEAFEDKKPHLYTLIIHPDNTFQVNVDNKLVNEGSLLEDFTPPVNPPPEIDDPDDRKPANWDEREQLPDPDAVKPDDWDENAPRRIEDPNAVKPSDWLENEPIMIPDPDAVKPADWDTDMDGEWEAPLIDNPACKGVSGCGKWEVPTIDNPEYKGKWRAPMIDNPNYQGKWRPRRIPNPDFFHDKNPFRMTSISAVGFELWSMSSSILFDNILITDSVVVAEDFAAKSFDLKRRKIEADSESLFTAFLRYSNDRPYLYAVYLVFIGLPIALILVYCCGSSDKDRDDSRDVDGKKTDAPQPDDEIPQPARSRKDLGVPDEGIDEDEEDEREDEDFENEDEEEEEEEQEEPPVAGRGDSAPRQRKPPRKE